MNKEIVVIESDQQTRQGTTRLLAAAVQGYLISGLETERDFQLYLSQLHTAGTPPPSLIIAETRIEYTYPDSPGVIVPREVMKEGYRLAGQRCWKAFRDTSWHRDTPWIYFTTANKEEMRFSEFSDSHTRYIEKGNSIGPLLAEVGRALHIPHLA